MLSVVDRLSILDSAERLNAARDYHALVELLSDRSIEDLLLEPTLAFLLATAWHFVGCDDDALELASKVEIQAEAGGESRLLLRCRNLLGALYVERGELQKAERMFRQILAAAAGRQDTALSTAATYNLAVIDTIRCNWSAALIGYERAASVAYAAGLHAWIGLNIHNIAMLYRHLGRYDEADAQFERALEFAMSGRQEEEVGFTEIERAYLQSLVGDMPLAAQSAIRGLTRARTLKNEIMEGEALRVLGAIAVRRREWSLAESYLSLALQIARRTSRRLLEAEVHEQIAMMDKGRGHAVSARDSIAAAQQIYRAMGADAHVDRLNELMLKWD